MMTPWISMTATLSSEPLSSNVVSRFRSSEPAAAVGMGASPCRNRGRQKAIISPNPSSRRRPGSGSADADATTLPGWEGGADGIGGGAESSDMLKTVRNAGSLRKRMRSEEDACREAGTSMVRVVERVFSTVNWEFALLNRRLCVSQPRS